MSLSCDVSNTYERTVNKGKLYLYKKWQGTTPKPGDIQLFRGIGFIRKQNSHKLEPRGI